MKNISKIISICILVCGSVTMANAFSLFGLVSSSDEMKKTSEVHNLAVAEVKTPTQVSRISRYTTQVEGIASNKIDLLQQNISISFSPSIITIKDAIEQLLQNSGYRLEPSDTQTIYTQTMLANVLPATQRSFQNATLKQILLALTGNNFQIVDDPVRRIITFKILPTVKAIYLNQGTQNG
jgi:conjugative transfer region protein (TIGR03748 family)